MATLTRNRALLSSLISALASVAVAFVGVLPALRAQDRETIAAQRARLDKLAQEREQDRDRIAAQRKQLDELAQTVALFAEAFEVGPSASAPRARWSITGRIRGARPGDGRGMYEVYLLPGSKQMYLTGDDGRFVFPEVFPGSYALVVRDTIDTRSKRTARGLITPEEPAGTLPLETHGPWADYKAAPQSVPTAAAADARPSNKSGTALAAASLPAQNGGLP